MTAPVVRPDVARFVQDVRAALGDLAPDEVDDLTEGLTADVTDALGDADVTTLGDPATYAAELRSAAGLPPRAAPGAVGGGTAAPRKSVADAVTGWLDTQAWWPATWSFLVVVRPVWWVVRGWAAYQLVSMVMGVDGAVVPRNPVALLVLIALVVASVQLGLRSDRFDAPRRVLVLAVNALVVLFLLAGPLAGGASTAYESQFQGPVVPSGLSVNGEPVRNVFAYDAEGRLVPVVQLYDQDGRPLELSDDVRSTTDGMDGSTRQATPAVNADGSLLWNVFPVRQAVVPGAGPDGEPLPTPAPRAAAPPFRSVAPVIGPTPGPTASPAASASPSPTPSPTASASPSAGSATPRPSVSPSAGTTPTP